MIGKRIFRMLLLMCLAGWVTVVEYRHNGVQPLFTAMLLGITLWAGFCLWADPDENASALARGGETGGRAAGNGGGPGEPCVPVAPKVTVAEPEPAATKLRQA